jgi:MFS family permease
VIAPRTPLNRQQIVGFWAAWFGWMLDGMDSVIFALVLAPALTELLPRSGMQASPANIGFVGSIMFALFLAGWGMSFIWGPISDKFGRTKSLAATVLVYAGFTGCPCSKLRPAWNSVGRRMSRLTTFASSNRALPASATQYAKPMIGSYLPALDHEPVVI